MEGQRFESTTKLSNVRKLAFFSMTYWTFLITFHTIKTQLSEALPSFQSFYSAYLFYLLYSLLSMWKSMVPDAQTWINMGISFAGTDTLFLHL